ncbi:MlaD family protein [Antrihabitans stalactiti]|jgi:phospholipid/cholesterol/gamma-HCH transport system substrate-binding protein|uniref:MCE family protein n=1 Tax=Antrihabitans stalactiti TaxID=2584121 RepID=A0A848K8W8_9NOCA|nr:MlaD family protein [Antrihabitans stalactiti]NMN95385.1 MCE family protein [Antrihabitans stalactiti]
MKRLLQRKTLLSTIGLILVFLVGAGYLMFNIMRINPLRSTFEATVNLDRSGGLQPNNDVTYRGFRVGKVKSIDITETGIAAHIEVNSSANIPNNGEVTVQALSAAGEQFIDFRPISNDGPFLGDGDVIEFNPERVKTPPPLSAVLDNMTGLVDQIDPEHFGVIVTELQKAFKDGGGPLRDVMQGASITLAGLDELLPQTVGLIANLRSIMATTSLAQPDLATLTGNTGVLFNQLNAANAELSNFLDTAGGNLSNLGGTVSEINEPATKLASSFLAIFNAAQLRTPALAALFPALRDGSAALAVPYWNGEFHVLADIWVRPFCDYTTVPRDAYKPVSDPRVPLYKYCDNPKPGQQVRGAANAPRPPGPDNTSGPPPGVTGDELSDYLPGS